MYRITKVGVTCCDNFCKILFTVWGVSVKIIAKEAGGVGRAVIKRHTATVKKNTLKIQLYWAGKGTTSIPYAGCYGPIISAISVDPGKLI
ncbi:putative Malectin domain-containing protein [Helianthus debilis subsp. tardiflorus]